MSAARYDHPARPPSHTTRSRLTHRPFFIERGGVDAGGERRSRRRVYSACVSAVVLRRCFFWRRMRVRVRVQACLRRPLLASIRCNDELADLQHLSIRRK
jgi:hypothetical protein